jgi:hypothetical protein
MHAHTVSLPHPNAVSWCLCCMCAACVLQKASIEAALASLHTSRSPAMLQVLSYVERVSQSHLVRYGTKLGTTTLARGNPAVQLV